MTVYFTSATLYGGQFIFIVNSVVKTKLLWNTLHWQSIMASLETYSLYSFELKKVAEVVKLKQESSAKYIAKESLFLT